MLQIFNGSVLKRLRLDAQRWLVLCEEIDDVGARYLVGLVGANGLLTDDALHLSLDSARMDFETRAILNAYPQPGYPTAA